MVRFFRYQFLQSSRRVNVTTLALILLSGYVSGGFCSIYADASLFQLMRTGAVCRVSIVSVLAVVLLPFLISVAVSRTGLSWLIIPLAFTKAFLFSYLCCAISVNFPGSGFLFSVLFLCSDYLAMPILCWFWYRCFCNNQAEIRAMISTFVLIAGIVIFDHQVISPFLASLLS